MNLNQVRKEKLGDRITALHQLVSPFGKVINKLISHSIIIINHCLFVLIWFYKKVHTWNSCFQFKVDFDDPISVLSFVIDWNFTFNIKRRKKERWVFGASLLQTDTASVLLEAIGYIRFLQSQIEVMFLYYSYLFILLIIIICSKLFQNKHAVKVSSILMWFFSL